MTVSVDRFLVGKANAAAKRLISKKLTVVTAESCTAGLIAACLSRARGASEILEGGFVTYTKDQKRTALRVPARLLARSSVTAEVAAAMARGALRASKAKVALAVTGVLGPTQDEDGNPVGLVFICCLRRGRKPLCFQMEYGAIPADRMRRNLVKDALAVLTRATR